MKKQTAIKILAAMLTILMLAVCMSSTVFANDTNANGDFLISPGDIKPTQTAASNNAQSIAGQILGVVQVIAVAVAVIMLIVLAIKYISSAPNDKAEIKKNAIVYVVGAIILFGAAGLLQLIQTFAKDAFKS